MKIELQEKLFQKYPELFKQKDLPPKQSCMCFGIECEDGWYGLIDFICKNINKNGGTEIFQIKEKFGGLRFYINHGNNEEFDLINTIEKFSYYVCERCGSTKDVEQAQGGWIKTLCKECLKKEGEKND